ncbi:putative zinc finger protein 833 [Drosophila busckii]|uniref:putative zinc finger protein 833 n=1 Tax=Drosophila busckii TaxID=30019 RepID=UPI00083EEF7A|nr:putative zinc finger protein 833 [Drosophila busckii]
MEFEFIANGEEIHQNGVGTSTIATNTNAIAPFRDRYTQTQSQTRNVGIQCRLGSHDDDDDDEDDNEWLTLKEDNEQGTGFDLFVSENTTISPNGMLQCGICGQVANLLVELQMHIEVEHFEQTALCFTCGKLLANRKLLERHEYSCRRPVIRQQCPHVQCDFMYSSMMQLRLHLQRHVNVYSCLGCQRKFQAITQFMEHRKPGCEHAYLSQSATTCRQKKNLKRCTVCTKRFSNARTCAWHRKRCLRAHYKRLKRLTDRQYA